MTARYFRDGWQVAITYTPAGHVYEYQRRFTLSGAAENFDLNLGFPFEIIRIEYFSDDATAKSFSERIYTGSVDTTSYDEIVTLTNDINQANAYYPTGADGTRTMSPITIRTAVSASTAGKFLTKKILLRRLQ